jgi:hypothetical protein
MSFNIINTPEQKSEYIRSVNTVVDILNLLDSILNDNDMIVKCIEKKYIYCIQLIKFVFAYDRNISEFRTYIESIMNTEQRIILLLQNLKGATGEESLYPIEGQTFNNIFTMHYSNISEMIHLYGTNNEFIKDKILFYINTFCIGGGDKSLEFHVRVLEEALEGIKKYIEFFQDTQASSKESNIMLKFVITFLNRNKNIEQTSWFSNIINSMKTNRIYESIDKEILKNFHNEPIFRVFNILFNYSITLSENIKDKFRTCIINGLYVLLFNINNKFTLSDQIFKKFICSQFFDEYEGFRVGCIDMIIKYQTNTELELVPCVDEDGIDMGLTLRKNVGSDGNCNEGIVLNYYNLDLQKKYLKYKMKYLKLKKMLKISSGANMRYME